MQNRGTLDWQTATARERPWETDAHPEIRLGVLFAGIVLLVAGVGVRFVWVQTTLTESYAVDFDRTYERTETIPSPDGRIISADGTVLAEDVLQIGLSVHYRWLEDPPNPLWLKQQALARLERSERRDKARAQSEVETVLKERERLWTDLAEITRASPAQLAAARREVQDRVERIRERAEDVRWERRLALERAAEPATNAEARWWESAWSSVVTTLTTPPRREAEEPLVVEEELSYHPVLLEIDPAVATSIEGHPAQFPGVRITEAARRVYPHSGTAPHVVGVRRPVDAEGVAQRRVEFPQGDPLDYRAGDRIGESGLEKQYDSILRGLRGERTLTVNRHGEVLQTRITRERRPGRDVALTLPLPFQREAEELLDEVLGAPTEDPVTGELLPLPPGASLVAIDVRTGAILACASGPRFDLNVLAEGDAEGWRAIQADPRMPLFDRATRMTLPPGSVFKAISAVAFLEGGHLDPEEPFHCQGYLQRPDQYRCLIFKRYQVGHADVTLVDALAKSCNVYFFHHAKQLGPEPLHLWAERFGIGQKTGVDLPGEQAGRLPSARPRRDERRIGETLQLSIGQADLTVTPLQMARMMAAIANGGTLVTPHFAERIGPTEASETALNVFESRRIPELSSRTLAWVRRGLQEVVANPKGTGYKTVRHDKVAIAGKTGTAEPGGGRPDHAWFAGYVPADRPKIAFAVVLEHAGSGGHAAGPVAKRFVDAMLQQGLLGRPATVTRAE